MYVLTRRTLFTVSAPTTTGGTEDTMSTLLRLLRPDAREARDQAHEPVPCAARPGTPFRHLDGPCQCFFGGPAPEFPPTAGSPA